MPEAYEGKADLADVHQIAVVAADAWIQTALAGLMQTGMTEDDAYRKAKEIFRSKFPDYPLKVK